MRNSSVNTYVYGVRRHLQTYTSDYSVTGAIVRNAGLLRLSHCNRKRPSALLLQICSYVGQAIQTSDIGAIKIACKRVAHTLTEQSTILLNKNIIEQNSTEQNRTERNGIEWNGIEWNGTERKGADWNGTVKSRTEWNKTE